MITRNKVISKAVDECLKELYEYVTPIVSWEEFKKQCSIYSEKYKKWEELRRNGENPDLLEFCGPRPYEFYYLPEDIFKDVVDSYKSAYELDKHEELITTIQILKDYCEKPIIDKYIEGENGFPGHRGYDHPDNLEKELEKIFDNEILPDICKQYNKQYNLQTTGIESSVSKAYSHIFQNKFFKFLDMAGNFFDWNRDLNSFNISVYLGPGPNSNKQAVIDNWKKYRKQDIEIDEEQIKKEYYGEELD